MPTGDTAEVAATGSETTGLVPNQIVSLVPTFDPSKDDLLTYSRKVELLVGMWPEGRWTELASRLILGCAGSAFLKLQIHQAEITKNEKKSIQRLIELLGGHWGQVNLERQYEIAERALFRCQQKGDESADSFLARSDIMWSELYARNIALKDLQPYITLRGSQLSAEDKKRVLLDVDAAGTGKLSMEKVSSSIRMLGAGFFQDMTGLRRQKGKTYDQAILAAEGMDLDENPTMATSDVMEEHVDDDTVETLAMEGDEDAALVADFESAATDLLQGDEDLAAAYNAYTEARRRLSEKVKFRGFWPIQQGSKGKSRFGGRGVKGKFSGKGTTRKTLQQRILESNCRICGRKGHWKAECPQRGTASDSSKSSMPQVPTSFAQSQENTSLPDNLPLEFLQLPVNSLSIDEPGDELVFVSSVFRDNPKDRLMESLGKWTHYISQQDSSSLPMHARSEDSHQPVRRATLASEDRESEGPILMSGNASPSEVACFATHGSYGVVDLGATKTVIGSALLPDLINNLSSEVQQTLTRCSCSITFRFGNHGILQSSQALVIPIQGFLLKVAIVPGSTPFLLSNTLLRALGAVIDTEKKQLHAKTINRTIPLQLTAKGLFLLDINELAEPCHNGSLVETHVVSDAKQPPETAPSESSQGSLGLDKRLSRSEDSHNHDEGNPEKPLRHPESILCPKPIATGFRVPSVCSQHVQFGSPTSETAHASRDRITRHESIQPGTNGCMSDRFRKSPSWAIIPRGMDQRPKLGEVVCQPLSGIEQHQTQDVHPLREPTCGESRTGRSNDCSHTDHRRASSKSSLKGQWEVMPQDGCQGQSPSDNRVSTRSAITGRVVQRSRGLHASAAGVGGRVPGCSTSGIQDAAHGECDVTGHCSLGADHDHREGFDTSREQVSEGIDEHGAFLNAGDICSDLCGESLSNVVVDRERNKENKFFQHMVRKIEAELFEAYKNHDGSSKPRYHLFEVFCGPQSQLTHQAQQLGFRSARYGYAQCDLQSSTGRQKLFRDLVSNRPENIWLSPTCGPWSKWSNLNGSKSLQAWEQLHEERLRHIEQIALGIVLLRHQRLAGSHFHWEQPQGSLMFRLPFLTETFFYLQAVDFEMCKAGNLRDPQNHLPMRKAMTVLTTSQRLVDKLKGYRCRGDHQHQVLEGQTVYRGERVNRTAFSENYPRKFARIVAQTVCKIQKPKELPYLMEESAYMNNSTDTTEPSGKRRRTSQQARLKMSRTLEATQVPWGKRLRLTGKTTTPKEAITQWEEVFDLVNKFLPRVGKKVVNDEGILQKVRGLVADKDVRYLVACRGSSRTMEPPQHITLGEAPYRKSIFTSRDDDQIRVEEQWEPWEELAKRQLVRPSHASHINITMFACNPVKAPEVSDSQSAATTRVADPADSSSPANPSVLQRDGSLTESQHCDLTNPKQPEVFRNLPRDEQSALIRCHKNLGHPSPERLSTVLRQQGYRSEVVRAALGYQCSVCQAGVQPKGQRPSTLRDEMDFNDRVSIDGIKWTNSKGQNFHFYHVIDWATNFQAACIAPSRTSTDTISNVISMWFSWAGSPAELVVDAGTEFQSDEFVEFVQRYNIKLIPTAPEAHFQHGKAERHGAILQHMLETFDRDHTIENYQDLQQALFWCVQAKNANSIRKGYAPEVLVLGKHTRMPGSISSDELLPAHLLADSETAQGLSFRKQLAYRECARKAFFSADNDLALRKAFLRRSHPLQQQYHPGEWVMVWREGKGAYPGHWQGPMKVVVHESAQVIWTTMASKLFRTAPEMVRPVTAMEARDIRLLPGEAPISKIAQQLEGIRNQGVTQVVAPPQGHTQGGSPDNIVPPNEPTDPSQNPSEHQSESQPDDEPSAPSENPSVPTPEGVIGEPEESLENDPNQVPVPHGDTDDDLIVEGLTCEDIEPLILNQNFENIAWRYEVIVNVEDIKHWVEEEEANEDSEIAFIATAAKRQRSEVRLAELSSEEKKEFTHAKQSEVQNWLKTGTVSKILRDKIPKEQILKCRWILTWKPLDQEDQRKTQKTHKAKARLVILGYLDPHIDQLPRDSPTLGRHSKMLMLQLIASMNWTLQSFDIKAAFLQGKPQTDRILGMEPTTEMMEALQMKTDEVCKLEKGAYGLIDAPYMWYKAILEELTRLGFEQSPFDPCVFMLREATTGKPEGVLGLHVDDGLCGGNHRFQTVLQELEKKYPFGSKRVQQFVFTGIDMQQHANKSISLSQSKYVRDIAPIPITNDRKKDPSQEVSPKERQELRALIGSLQYASVHTRPDISSRLS